MESEKKLSSRRLFVVGAVAALALTAYKDWPYASDVFHFSFPEFIASPLERTIPLKLRDSYTFISAGDSLAAGLRGIDDVRRGVPESWVGPMVTQLNTTRRQYAPLYAGSSDYYPDWQYAADSSLFPILSKAGLTSSGLLDTMRDPNVIQALSTPYQAVLCLSVGFNDIYGLRDGTPLDLLTLHTKLDKYQENIQSIIALFKAARAGKKERPSCMLLGLPELDSVPAVAQAVRGTFLEGRANFIAKEVNQRMAAVCDAADGISIAYVDLFNHLSVSPSLISSDGLHPNAYGYERIGAIASRAVHITA